jgi:hypothetical protein
MNYFKSILVGFVAGASVGLWFGVNLGKEQPIFSNPFTDAALTSRIKQTGEKIMEKSGDVMEKSGQKLEEGGQAIKRKLQEDDTKGGADNGTK